MKKGLLTLLAASLVFVGCQNYDDQFDDLNAQISALKSQVDGLSSLSGQVASLSGSISGLQAGVSAAQAAASAASSAASDASAAVAAIPATDLSGLEASLATLAAEVDAVQASLATAATASDVATLQAELDAIQADVDELLATSNVYTKDLTISSAAGLDAAYALGNNINIVNGTVTISQSTSMDATKLQTVIDRIFTVTGNYTYTAGATSVTPMTFDKLASVADLTLTVNGPISAKTLVSAGTIDLKTTYTSKVTGINFDALTSVTEIETDNGTDNISFTSATDVQLGALANYPGAGSDYGLTITTKKGATLDIASLDDVSATGAATDVALTITGPKDVNISKITSYSGSISATNVENLTLDGFKGVITVNSGVENINIKDAEQFVLNSATDLETVVLDVDKASDPDLSTTVKAVAAYAGSITAYTGETPDLSFASMPDLVSVTLTGFFGDLSFASLSDLTTIDIEATFNDLTVSNNDNLVNFDVTGSTFNDVTSFTGNDAITSLELDHTTGLAFNGSTSSDDRALISVTSNAELTSLTVSASKIRNLTVTGNTKMTKVDFTGWASLGTAQSTTDYPSIAIYSNGLVASQAKDTDDGTTQYSIDGTNDASDKGSFTTTSGMETLATALGLIKAIATSDADVHFDTVSSHVIDTDGAASGETAGEQNSGNALTYATNGGSKTNWVGAVYINTKSSLSTTNSTAYNAVKAKKAILLENTSGEYVSMSYKNGSESTVEIFETGGTYGNVLMTGNNTLDVNALKSSLAVTRAAALGLTLDVAASGQANNVTITFLAGIASTAGANGENFTNTTAEARIKLSSYTAYTPALLTTWDKVTLNWGDSSVTVTLTTDQLGAAYAEGVSAVSTLVENLAIAWDTKYDTGAASANYSIWATASTYASAASLTLKALTLKASTAGSRGFGVSPSITWNSSAATAARVSYATGGLATGTLLAWYEGATDATTDNTSTGQSLIVTLEEVVAGSGATGAVTLTIDSVDITTLVGQGTATNTTKAGLLSTNLVSYGTGAQATVNTGTGIYPTEARSDVTWGQAAFEGLSVTTGTDRVTYSRIHWLSS
jgi:hypothetical protein